MFVKYRVDTYYLCSNCRYVSMLSITLKKIKTHIEIKKEIAMLLNQKKPKIYQSTSCHQCKTRKKSSELIRCSNSDGKNGKKCVKKYCIGCINKKYASFYITEEQPCPACRGICTCPYCTKKSDNFLQEFLGNTGNSRAYEEYVLKSNDREQFGNYCHNTFVREGDNGGYGPLHLPINNNSDQYKKSAYKGLDSILDHNNGGNDADLPLEIFPFDDEFYSEKYVLNDDDDVDMPTDEEAEDEDKKGDKSDSWK